MDSIRIFGMFVLKWLDFDDNELYLRLKNRSLLRKHWKRSYFIVFKICDFAFRFCQFEFHGQILLFSNRASKECAICV